MTDKGFQMSNANTTNNTTNRLGFLGSLGFLGKAAITATSTVANLYTASTNALVSTSIGAEINNAKGIKGSWNLGDEYAHSLTSYAVSSLRSNEEINKAVDAMTEEEKQKALDELSK